MADGRQNEAVSDAGRYLSIAVNLTGEPCLIVGGGPVGLRKAKVLAAAGARVTFLAPEVCTLCREWIDSGGVTWVPKRYRADAMTGMFFVVAATSDPAINREVARDARARGILCCGTGLEGRSQVVFPATWANDEIAVAVHSHGRDYRKSQAARDAIVRRFLES